MDAGKALGFDHVNRIHRWCHPRGRLTQTRPRRRLMSLWRKTRRHSSLPLHQRQREILCHPLTSLAPAPELHLYQNRTHHRCFPRKGCWPCIVVWSSGCCSSSNMCNGSLLRRFGVVRYDYNTNLCVPKQSQRVVFGSYLWFVPSVLNTFVLVLRRATLCPRSPVCGPSIAAL